MATIARKTSKNDPTHWMHWLGRWLQWLTAQQQRLTQWVIGLVLVAVGAVAYGQWSSHKHAGLAQEFALAYVHWQDGTPGASQPEVPGKEAGQDGHQPVATEQRARMRQKLADIMVHAPAEQLGVLAALLDKDMEEKQLEETAKQDSTQQQSGAQASLSEPVDRLSPLVEQLSPRHPLYFLIIEKLAYQAETQQQLEQALALWQKIPVESEIFYADQALLQQIRLRLALGQIDQAKEQLGLARLRFPESAFQADMGMLQAQIDLVRASRPTGAPQGSEQVATP